MLRLAIEFNAAALDSSGGHDKLCHVMDVFQMLDLNTEESFCKELFHFGAALELEQGEVFFDGVAFPAAPHAPGFNIGFPALAADRDDVILRLVQSIVRLAALVGLHAAVEALPFKDRVLRSERLDEVVQSHQCHSPGSE